MPAKPSLMLTLAGALALAVATPALAAGPLPPGRDDVSYGDAPPAEAWHGVDRADGQDDSRMLPPQARPGSEAKSGTAAGAEYDPSRMLPAEA